MASEDKVHASNTLIQHVKEATDARSAYNGSVKAARSDLSNCNVPMDGQMLSCTNDLFNVHYTFDYARPVTLPQHARQAGLNISRPLGKFRYLECVLKGYINT